MHSIDDYLLDASRFEFVPRWSLYQSDRLSGDAVGVEDDNELSFDAPSTVDMRVVSSNIWASTVEGACSDSDDMAELITIIQGTSSTTTDEEDDVETVICRSPRLIGEDEALIPPAFKTLYLPPAPDATISTACMLDLLEQAVAIP